MGSQQLNRSTSTDPIFYIQQFHDFFSEFAKNNKTTTKMGRLLKSLFICGSTSYTKFENNDTKSDYLCYKCENCGHQGTVKPERLTLVENPSNDSDESDNDDARKLNNCKNVENHKNSLRLVNNLGTSWTRRNLLMQRLHYKDQQSPEQQQHQLHRSQKCIEDNDQLLASPWFQEGLSRDITSEILSERPEGSFVVRQSTSRPDCFALSVRVPSGSIAHYLINAVQSPEQSFFRIQGSKKMFRSLVSLVIHHSVMAENLPCPLLIDHSGAWIRNDGTSFNNSDNSSGICLDNHSRDHDFADTDLDDYSNLMMTLRKSISSSTSDVSSMTSID